MSIKLRAIKSNFFQCFLLCIVINMFKVRQILKDVNKDIARIKFTGSKIIIGFNKFDQGKTSIDQKVPNLRAFPNRINMSMT